MAGAFRQTILGSRPLAGRDLIQSEQDPPSGLDAAEFKARTDQAVQALTQALAHSTRSAHAVESAAECGAPAALETLRERLLDLVFLRICQCDAVFAPRFRTGRTRRS